MAKDYIRGSSTVRQRDYEDMQSGKNSAPRGNASEANRMHGMLDSEHAAKDAFVKRQQAEVASMAGKNPVLEPRLMEMNANMVVTGSHAKEFGRELTRGLDKRAFPVK